MKMFFFVGFLFFCIEVSFAQKSNTYPSLAPVFKTEKKTKQNKGNGDFLDVFVFFSPDCPICKVLVPHLNEVWQKYKEKPARFYTVIPHSLHYSKRETKKNEIIDSLLLNTYIDKKNKLTNQLQATVTPQVIVVYQSKIIYSGKINDLYLSVGVQKKTEVQNYLLEVLEAHFNNKKIQIENNAPVGCYINPLP